MAYNNSYNNQYQNGYQNNNQSQLPDQSMKFTANNQEVSLKPSFVRNFLTSGNGNVTDQEVVMFMNLCKYQHLNPFDHDAYLVKYGKQPAQIITSREAFMKRAEANKHYKGIRSGVILVDKDSKIIHLEDCIKRPDDVLIGGWAEIIRDDRDKPIHVGISFDEFAKRKSDGELQATWKQMPMYMIMKTAEVNALRTAFPESLGSLYTKDDKRIDEEPRQVEADEHDSKIEQIAKKRQEESKESQKKESIDSNVSSESSKEIQNSEEPIDPATFAEEFAKSKAGEKSSSADNQKSSANNNSKSSEASGSSKGDVINAQTESEDQSSLDLDFNPDNR